MTSRSRMGSADEAERRSSTGRDFGPAIRLLGTRCISFVWLVVVRVAVGFCDLLLAAALYLLFLLLQGGSPARHLWWTPKTILSIALTTSALIIFRALLDMFSTKALFLQKQNLYLDLLSRLMRGYSEMQWGRFVERNRSELVSHTTHTASEAANFYHYCVELSSAVVVVAIMSAALVYQSPVAACGLGIAVILFYFMHRVFIRRRLQLAASHREQSLQTLRRSLSDVFLSGKEIRTYKNQDFFYERVNTEARNVAAGDLHIALLPQIARIIADQGVVLLFLCVVVAVQLRQGDTRQLLSLLAFYFVLSRRLLPLISHISFMAGHMESSYENVRIVDSELRECLRYCTPTSLVDLPVSHADFVVELEEVSFSFHEKAPVLRNLNFRLRKGEMILLNGSSGSGKSSLLNLIAGVLQPTCGVVRADRTRIAYVPQEVPLLDDSIRNNLLFGLLPKSDAELMRALEVAKLDKLVETEPSGLETRIGDNGILFSGGERQRLGLARAVLRGVSVLLLDEATSALDPKTERGILENLRASGMTILLVTHRSHIQKFAQRVLRLAEGCLVEESSLDRTMNEQTLSAYSAG